MNKVYGFVAMTVMALIALCVMPAPTASASSIRFGKDREAVYKESAFFKAGTGIVEGRFEGPKVPGFLEYYG